MPSTVFISYSHSDTRWKDRLVSQLGVLQHEGLLNIWHDDLIQPGADWLSVIEAAMAEARIAIFIVSAAFLNSDFIRKKEIRTLMARREKEGLRIIPVIASPCPWRRVPWLAKTQAWPRQKRTLAELGGVRATKVLADLAEEILSIDTLTRSADKKFDIEQGEETATKAPTKDLALVAINDRGKGELTTAKPRPTEAWLTPSDVSINVGPETILPSDRKQSRPRRENRIIVAIALIALLGSTIFITVHFFSGSTRVKSEAGIYPAGFEATMNIDPSHGSIGIAVTAPVALVNFLVTCVSIIYLGQIWARKKRIEKSIVSLPKQERAQVVEQYLARYKVMVTNLTVDQKLSFVKREIKNRLRLFQFFAAFFGAVSLVSLVLLILQAPPPKEPLSAPNQRVLHYKAQILELRGGVEAKSLTSETVLRQRGLQLAGLIGEFDESQLEPAVKIIQHEYRGWAFLMGVSTFSDTPPKAIPATRRIEYATKAIAEFDLALGHMAAITRAYNDGESYATPVYEWMTSESEDVNRTHYLKAIALAVIARAGGGTPLAAISELAKIESTYLATFPAENNPDLAWALGRKAGGAATGTNGGTDAPL